MAVATTTPTRIELRPSRLVGLLVAAALASAALTLGVVVTVDSVTEVDQAEEARQVGLSQAYTDGLAGLPPGELGWAYRSTPRWAIGLTAAQRAYVEGMRRMTPEELHAAFSRRLDTTPVDSSVSAADSTARAAYVQGIVAMNPDALRAAFGWHSDGSE